MQQKLVSIERVCVGLDLNHPKYCLVLLLFTTFLHLFCCRNQVLFVFCLCRHLFPPQINQAASQNQLGLLFHVSCHITVPCIEETGKYSSVGLDRKFVVSNFHLLCKPAFEQVFSDINLKCYLKQFSFPWCLPPCPLYRRLSINSLHSDSARLRRLTLQSLCPSNPSLHLLHFNFS